MGEGYVAIKLHSTKRGGIMNYIAEIKAFYDLVQVKQLSTGQVALWHALMVINNKCAWIEWFTVPNLTLELYTGLSRSGVYKARNALKQLGIIDFKPNGTKATSYKLVSLLHSTQESNRTDVLVSESKQVGKQVGKQDRKQVGNQGGKQVGKQSSNTLNKLNETKLDDLPSSDRLALNRDDDDDQFSEVAKEFRQVFGYPPNQTQVQMITSFLTDGLTTWHILEALKRTAEAGVTNPRYTQAILQRWMSLKAFTPEDVDRLDKLRQPKFRDQDRKFTREDFTFSEPPKPDPQLFPFLAAVTKEDDADAEQETDRL
jgi:DNA replication protein DnaD